MSAVSQSASGGSDILFRTLHASLCVVIESGPPPWRAVPRGDTRCRPLAWIDKGTLEAWRLSGHVRRHPKGWEVRPGPRPIITETPQGPRPAEVRETWMQRLARDLDLEGPLADAGLRLMADHLSTELDPRRAPEAPMGGDGRPRATGVEEARLVRRLDARARLHRALGALKPAQARVAQAVCIHDRALASIAAEMGVDEDAATDLFRLALLRLARFYGTLPGVRPG